MKKSFAGLLLSVSGTPFTFIESPWKFPAHPRSPSYATTPIFVAGVPSAGVRNPETVVLTTVVPLMFA